MQLYVLLGNLKVSKSLSIPTTPVRFHKVSTYLVPWGGTWKLQAAKDPWHLCLSPFKGFLGTYIPFHHHHSHSIWQGFCWSHLVRCNQKINNNSGPPAFNPFPFEKFVMGIHTFWIAPPFTNYTTFSRCSPRACAPKIRDISRSHLLGPKPSSRSLM